ncbi:membrane protein [Pseudomonas soli]|nr:membrane protein [Pseudomonas soli]
MEQRLALPRQRSSSLILLGFALLCVASLMLGGGPDYGQLVATLDQPLSRLRWIVGDISEVAFYKHELPALGLLLGASLAHWAQQRGHRWQGFAICYGTGLWPWLIISSLLGLLLSHALWGWTLDGGAWQPTFVAFVSLPAAMVLLFGGGWRVVINGALLGAVLVTPASLLLVNYLCYPLQLPVVIGNVSGMALASVLAFLLCKRFPALVRDGQRPEVAATASQPDYGLVWTLRRVLADFSEAPFFGNELASLGLLLGVLLAYVLAPSAPAYGSQLVLQMVAGQGLASLVGVLFWRRQWKERGWYPTYIPIVSIVPAAVLTLGGSWQVVVASAVLGALIAPPLAVAISRRLPGYMHGYIGNVLSMAISTLGIVPLVGLLAGGNP